ncbi:MAG: four helix bundle protein [Bacteroidales bacterium]|nr:four helix bundle protein [Bacteroidales bacterium]
MKKENVILDLSFNSVGANIREAQNAESKSDFIHKMKIAAKETDETEYWFLLCKYSKSYSSPDPLIDKIISLKKLLSKIISTTKNSLKGPLPSIH